MVRAPAAPLFDVLAVPVKSRVPSPWMQNQYHFRVLVRVSRIGGPLFSVCIFLHLWPSTKHPSSWYHFVAQRLGLPHQKVAKLYVYTRRFESENPLDMFSKTQLGKGELGYKHVVQISTFSAPPNHAHCARSPLVLPK